MSRDRNRERRNSRRHEENNHEDKNEANESEDNGGLLELIEDPVEEVMPRRKVVRKPKAMLLRNVFKKIIVFYMKSALSGNTRFIVRY